MSRTPGSASGPRLQQAHARNGLLRKEIAETLQKYGELSLYELADKSGYAEPTVRRAVLWMVEDGIVRNRPGNWNKAFYSLRIEQ